MSCSLLHSSAAGYDDTHPFAVDRSLFEHSLSSETDGAGVGGPSSLPHSSSKSSPQPFPFLCTDPHFLTSAGSGGDAGISGPSSNDGARRSSTATTATLATMMSTNTAATGATAVPNVPIYPRGLVSGNTGVNSSFPISFAVVDTTSSAAMATTVPSPLIIKVQHRALPYIRELVPGKDIAGAGVSSSAHSSRDLEIVLEEVTGRLRTNRTSIDPYPWPYTTSIPIPPVDSTLTLPCWAQKPLPPVRREPGSRYWVFWDDHHKSAVLGPILFLLGHLCPILWWIGAFYPTIDHPEDVSAAAEAEVQARARARARAHVYAQTQAQQQQAEASELRDHPMIQWLQKQLRAVGATISSIKTSVINNSQNNNTNQNNNADRQSTIATLQIVRISEEDGYGHYGGHSPDSSGDYENHYYHLHQHLYPTHNVSTINVPSATTAATMGMGGIPTPPHDDLDFDRMLMVDRHGPWAAAETDHASSLFEQRIQHDHKVLRYELDLRWRRINLIWAIGSFVLAITITAFVIGFATTPPKAPQ